MSAYALLKHTRFIVLTIYIVAQIALLFCLRKFYLLTVFQTVVTYAAVSVMGIFLLFLATKKPEFGKGFWSSARDSYLIVWSGFHGVIVLGFMTCGTYYLTLTQVTFVQLVNIFLGFAVYWFFYVLCKSSVTAIGWGNLLIGIIGTANYYLMRFRGAPFQLSDFKAARTAGTVASNYDFTPTLLLVITLADLILWYVVWKVYLQTESKKKHWHICKVLGTAVICLGCIALPVLNFREIYANTLQFAQDTYLSTLLAEVMGSSKPLPDDYSVDEVTRIVEQFRDIDESESAQEVVAESAGETNGEMMQPNIVVIMNEAFADLRVLGEFETTETVLTFWDSLEENCIRGWANVSVLGGSTANSEYEFLTSDAVALYSNEIPYNRYFSSGDEYPSLVSVLEEQGYESVAFHPYLSSGWNQTQVYRAMGFDQIIFEENLEEELDTMRIYTSDEANYAYIQSFFEEKEAGTPQFFFNVTMQNHGGYTYDGKDFETTVHLTGSAEGQFPQTEQYLSLVQASDSALEGLLSYFETYEEPVIVVMFGDHQPRLEDEFYEYVTGQPIGAWDIVQRMNQYKTPFIIWHNYDAKSADIGDVSLSYLASIMMENTGLGMSEYQQYVLEQYQKMPVVNAIGMQDGEGNVFPKGSQEYVSASEDYRDLIYNHTADKENRVEEFFELER